VGVDKREGKDTGKKPTYTIKDINSVGERQNSMGVVMPIAPLRGDQYGVSVREWRSSENASGGYWYTTRFPTFATRAEAEAFVSSQA
jgi:hypothetical protein